MKVLIACEESQRVCAAFREKGHEAYSCGIIEPSGGHPEWHVLGDALKLISKDCKEFTTMDGVEHKHTGWDILIAHPPCTYLTVSGNAHFNVEKYGQKAIDRLKKREEAIAFVMKFAECDIPKIAIENPIGVLSSRWKKPSQIISPHMFGDHTRKSTCLWLKGLPNLTPTDIVDYEIQGNGYSGSLWHAVDDDGKIIPWDDPRTAKIRSKTFPGIAKAMAEQWG